MKTRSLEWGEASGIDYCKKIVNKQYFYFKNQNTGFTRKGLRSVYRNICKDLYCRLCSIPGFEVNFPDFGDFLSAISRMKKGRGSPLFNFYNHEIDPKKEAQEIQIEEQEILHLLNREEW